MVNPCCGRSLQRGVELMAKIDIVMELINLGLLIGALVGVVNITHGKNSKHVGVAAHIIAIVLSLMAVGLAVRLLKGAKNKDLRNCKVWFIVTCIVLTINLITFIANASVGEIQPYDISATILSTLYRLYMLWVVFSFIQELKTGGPNVGLKHKGAGVYVDPQTAIPSNDPS